MNKTQTMVKGALLAALTTVATMVIHIPSSTNGFVNLGDCFVLLAGWLLGPFWGFLAGGIGSAMADMLLGYTHYVPGTFIIKGLTALIAAVLFEKLKGKGFTSLIVSSVVGEAEMVLGYFLFASLILGKGMARALSIPGNVFQATVGIIAGIKLYKVAEKTGMNKGK